MHELNEEIRDKEIRLIGSEGEQLGIMPPAEALKIADEQGLDLVKISPQAVPPVCKLMTCWTGLPHNAPKPPIWISPPSWRAG